MSVPTRCPPASPRQSTARVARACVVLAGVLLLWPASAQAQTAQGPPPQGPPPLMGPPQSPPPACCNVSRAPLRVFLDCNECDTDYVTTSVTFVDYVRDRAVADLHVLVTTQTTGGGGKAWTLKLIGQGRFQNHDHTLTFNTAQTASNDDERKEFARILKLGLVSYAADSSVLPKLDVSYASASRGDPAQMTPAKDPWNFWNFRVNGNGNFNGEVSSTSHAYRFGAEANRTTEQWKMNFSANREKNTSRYMISDTETVKSLSSDWSGSGLVVKSLGPKWSLGGRGSVSHSSYSNESRTVAVAPGIEYDVFPYSESTRRSLTFQYSVSMTSYRYLEPTVYHKLAETVPSHSLNVSLGLRQPWGSLFAAATFSQHLNHTDRVRASLFAGTDVRLFKGFAFNIFADYSKIKDQISLRRGEASEEEVLLRLRQLASNYSYSLNFGISYSFGSIFNNVVNPRFGGSGGGGMHIMF